MAQLFQRAAQVIVGNLDGTTAFQTTFAPGSRIPGLRVVFHFKRTLRAEPSTADISIYNMNKQHRSLLKTRYAPVILSAGYTDTIARVFSGQARTIDHVRHGPDWVTKIQLGDGEVPYRYTRLSKSYGTGVGSLQVANDLIGQLGPTTPGTGAVLEANLTDQLSNGYLVHGPAARELSRLLHGRGLEWSIQHGKVQVLPVGKPSTQTAVLLTPSTGLIGSPEHGTPDPTFKRTSAHTLKWRAFIQPTLDPGGMAQIQSNAAKGNFRIISVEGSGDTQSGDWFMSCEGNPVS